MNFAGKVTVVTGGASGIGLAVVRNLSARGAHVLVADIHQGHLGNVVKENADREASVQGLAVDVSEESEVTRLFDQVDREWGGLDFLVNCAGISPKKDGQKVKLWEMAPEEWDRVLAVNLRGTFLCCRAALSRMIVRGGGAVVNLSSMAAKAGSAVTGSHYAASKAGIVGLTKVLAREAADYGIRVNAVSPGRIDTPMIWDVPPEVNARYEQIIPLKRLGRPEEVAEAIVFFLSDAASYITGQVLDINGGSGMFY